MSVLVFGILLLTICFCDVLVFFFFTLFLPFFFFFVLEDSLSIVIGEPSSRLPFIFLVLEVEMISQGTVTKARQWLDKFRANNFTPRQAVATSMDLHSASEYESGHQLIPVTAPNRHLRINLVVFVTEKEAKRLAFKFGARAFGENWIGFGDENINVNPFRIPFVGIILEEEPLLWAHEPLLRHMTRFHFERNEPERAAEFCAVLFGVLEFQKKTDLEILCEFSELYSGCSLDIMVSSLSFVFGEGR